MARITWQNVDAPDFRGSGELLRGFAQSLDQGLQRASQGLAGFDAIKDDEASRLFAIKASQYSDPETLQADLSTGKFWEGINTSRIAPETIIKAPAMVDSLIAREGEMGNLDWSQFTRGRDKETLALQDAAAPILAEIAAAQRANNPALAAKLESENAGVLGRLRMADVFSTQENLQGLETGAIANEGGRIGNQQGAWNYNVGVEDRNITKQAATIASGAIAGMADADSARNALFNSDAYKSADPRAQIMALDEVNRHFGIGILGEYAAGPSGPDSGSLAGVSGGVGGLPADKVMNYEARAVGFDVVPDSVRTLGQARAFAKQVNRAGASSSAMGLFQITGQTMEEFGKKLYKDQWQNTPWNADTQNEIGEAIFNASKGSAKALRGRWVSLSMAEAERVRKLPWSEARKIIGQKESGANFDNVANAVAGATQVSNINATDSAGRVVQAANDLSSISRVTIEATKKGGIFEGMPAPQLRTKVAELIEKSTVGGVAKLNPAQAIAILADAYTAEGRDNPGGLMGMLGVRRINPNKNSWNQSYIDKAVTNARRGVYEDATVAVEKVGGAVMSVQAATAQYTSALAAFQAAQERAVSQPGLKKTLLPRLAAKVEAARQQLAAAREGNQNTVGAIRETSPRAPSAIARPGAMDRGPAPQPTSWLDVLDFGGLFRVKRK